MSVAPAVPAAIMVNTAVSITSTPVSPSLACVEVFTAALFALFALSGVSTVMVVSFDGVTTLWALSYASCADSASDFAVANAVSAVFSVACV